MVEPGTAAIAVLSTIAGISGYGAMKINSKQNTMIEAEIQRRIQGVKNLLRATEAAKLTAEQSLQKQKSEVERLAQELRTMKAAKETLEREKSSLATRPPPAATPPPVTTPPPVVRPPPAATPPPTSKPRSPADSFFNSVDTLTAEADLRERELKEIEDILAERLKEAEADTSTEGKIVIGRLKKAATTAKQARDRVKTARTKFKDTVSSYDRKVKEARRTLRSFRKDPEDVKAAETTLRLPPTDVQEEVSSTLDDAGAIKVDLDAFLQGKTTALPAVEDTAKDAEAIETGVLAEQKARKEQRKAEMLAEEEEEPVLRLPSRRSSFTTASTPKSLGGGVRKNKLRTRRGDTQNGRRTRRSKNRANRTHSNPR